MAFGITSSPETPVYKTDYNPADRKVNFEALVKLIGSYVPLTPEGVITFDEETLTATIDASVVVGELTYQWVYGATEDLGTNIASATSTSVELSSTHSEKYLGCKVTNTLNGVTNVTTILFGQLPEIAAE